MIEEGTMKVVIVGSGMMGSGIAARSALAGNQTCLVDLDRERAERGCRQARACVRELWENELCGEAQARVADDLIAAEDDLVTALEGCGMVIEAIVEDLAAKQKLFAELDRLTPQGVPVLSNTSGLRITEIASGAVCHPERTATAHFWFPAHLVPLVEVVMWDRTDPEIAEQVKRELRRWGKAPVIVKKDLPGQLANRILQAVIREASNIVEMGLAEPEDVDMAVKMGMGIRFPVWGPLEHVDGVGVDLCLKVQDTVLPGISGRTEANDTFRDMVKQGNLGFKSGKGFYDWSCKDMAALEKKRNDFIIYALKKIEI